MSYKMETIIIPVQDSEDSSSNDSDSYEAAEEQLPEPHITISEAQQRSKTILDISNSNSSSKVEIAMPESPTGKRRISRRAHSAVASSKKRRKKRKKKFRIPGSTATSSHSNSISSKDSSVSDKTLRSNSYHVDNRKSSADVSDHIPAPSQASLNAMSSRRIASAPANSANRKITRKEITPRAKLKLTEASSKQDSKAEESTKSEATGTSNTATGSVHLQDTKITKLNYKPSNVRLLNSMGTTPKATAITAAPLPSSKVNNDVSIINPSMSLSNNHHVITDKQRAMLLALSKESFQRTLPPVLHHNQSSLNNYGNNDNSKDGKTAVSRYTSPVSSYSNKNIVLQRGLANPRCIPIVPDTDCTKTRLTRSQSASCLGYRNELNSTKSLISSSGSNIDSPPKSILKEKINNRPYTARYDKKKSVRFLFSDDEND